MPRRYRERICEGGTRKERAEAERIRLEDFERFDLSVLTPKQLDVLVMRYRGGLSWRKIAAFESVDRTSIRDRHRLILRKLRTPVPPTSR